MPKQKMALSAALALLHQHSAGKDAKVNDLKLPVYRRDMP